MRTSAKKVIANVLWVALVTTVLAAILFPVFAKAKTGRGRNLCLSRMKQLGTATLIYAADADETLPVGPSRNGPSLLGWTDRLLPYTKNRDLYRDPLEPGAEISYGMNANFADGPKLTGLANPSHTVLYFEVASARLEDPEKGPGLPRLAPVADGAADGLLDTDDLSVGPVARYATGALANSGLDPEEVRPRHAGSSYFVLTDSSAKRFAPPLVSAGANARKSADKARSAGCSRSDLPGRDRPCAAGTSTGTRATFSIK